MDKNKLNIIEHIFAVVGSKGSKGSRAVGISGKRSLRHGWHAWDDLCFSPLYLKQKLEKYNAIQKNRRIKNG